MTLPYRSLLFTPGHEAEMLESALETDADAFVFDLEDGVPADETERARDVLGQFLADRSGDADRRPHFVRVTDVATDLAAFDFDGQEPDGFWLPKVQDSETVARAASHLADHGSSATLVPMIEDGAGIVEAAAIARQDRVVALAMGAEDYVASVGASPTAEGHEIDYARQCLVAAADAAGIGAIDSVYTDFSDAEGLATETARSVRLGYDAKPAIHPAQIDTINEAFAPSEDELAWARRVLGHENVGEIYDVGAVNVDGEMIEAPHVERARDVLTRAEREDDES